jgi:glutamyl-tRNA reductase
VVVGIDHRSATIAQRERVAFRADELPLALSSLSDIAREGFILSTCNRIELYALQDDVDPAELIAFLKRSRGVGSELDEIVYTHTGVEAISHFFQVSTGMVSMMLGEPHILTQVRQALDAARDAGTLGPTLSRVGADALRVGKRARSETDITRDGASIPRATVERATAFFGGLAGRRAVVLGAGQMGGHSARLLAEAGVGDLVILNRTPTRAEALARTLNCRYGSLDSRDEEINRADLVVSAANLPDRYMIDAVTLRDRTQTPRLIIDLGLPRTVDPGLRTNEGVTLCDVDDLDESAAERQTAHASDISAIEAMIASAIDEFLLWNDERAVAPTIAALQAQAEAIRQSELERALRRLGSLSDRDREVVSALSVAVVNKLLHGPMTRVKQDRNLMEPAAQALFGLSPDNL